MSVTYNKLWHLLIDRGMKKKDLKEAAGLTSHAMMKLRNNEDITTQTIARYVKHSDAKLMIVWSLLRNKSLILNTNWEACYEIKF